MATSNDKITMHGNPLEVTGTPVKAGSMLPDFTVSNKDLKDAKKSDYAGKVLVISVIPSIDTPVCQVQTKRFNQEASELSDKVAILTVSRDLPFAQKRWCAAEGVERVECLSDYKYRTFGKAFGVDIENIGLLARAIFVADTDGTVKHVEYVSEISEEPDYDGVVGVIKGLVG